MEGNFQNGFYGEASGCNSKEFRGFFEVLANEIVQKLSPKLVLNLDDQNCCCLVELLRNKGVEAYGLNVFEAAEQNVSSGAFEFCVNGSVWQNLPQQFPEKFNLVVCCGVLNKFFAHEIAAVVNRLTCLADDVLIGFFSGADGLGEVNFSCLAGFFAQNEFFKSRHLFFKNEFCEVSLFSKRLKKFDVVQAYEQQLSFLNRKLTELQKTNLKLKNKVLTYSSNFVNLKLVGQRYADLKHDHTNALIELNVLRSSYARYRAVTDSTFWKLTKPLRVCSDFFRINVLGFCRAAVNFFVGRSWKKGVEEIKQRYSLNVYGAYFKKTRPTEQMLQNQRLVEFKKNFIVSVVVPIYNSSVEFLQQLIDSMRQQTYKFWQLCLADGSDAFHFKERALCEQCACQDPRIKYVKLEKNLGIAQNTNEALSMATGDYIALLDHDDLLSPDALFECMKVVEEQGADFIYSDEMTFENNVENVQFIHFKPDFSPDTLRSNNYICHLSLFSKNLSQQVGGFSSDYDGSQDYDMILRLTEKAKKIVHIPKILYYWRVHSRSVSQDLINKPYCLDSAKKAIAAHLNRLGLKGKVLDSRYPSTYRVEYELQKRPMISIVILNRNDLVWLKTCVESILTVSTYSNYEILIVENCSNEQTFDFYEVLTKKSDKIRVVAFNGEGGFNYSALVNFGVSKAKGDYFVLLHNDICVLTPNWLEQLLMFAQRPEVGAVGAKLLYNDETVQGGGYFLSRSNVAMNAYRLLAKNEGGYVCRACLAQNLSAVSAGCLMTNREVWNDVSGFDLSLAVNFSDVDFCLRLRQKGYLIIFNADVELLHNETSNRKKGRGMSFESMVNFENELAHMKMKWADVLKEGDPYYNSNFDDNVCDFSIKKK